MFVFLVKTRLTWCASFHVKYFSSSIDIHFGYVIELILNEYTYPNTSASPWYLVMLISFTFPSALELRLTSFHFIFGLFYRNNNEHISKTFHQGSATMNLHVTFSNSSIDNLQVVKVKFR